MTTLRYHRETMTPHPPSAIEQGRPAAPPVNPAKPDVGGPERPRSSGKLWLWLFIIVVIGAGLYYFYGRSKNDQPSTAKQAGKAQGGGRGGRNMGVPPVVAVKATKGNIGVYFIGLGAVTPIFTVSVKSRVDGQLMKVNYHEGQMIHEGDSMLEIDPRPYEVQLAQAEGQLLRDQASLANAKIDVARYEQLITRRAVPEQTLATQRALVAQDEGTVKTDQAAIDNAKLNLTYCHITAPITGRLGLRLVDPGNYIQAGAATPLAVITQVDPISVIFTLPEDQLTQVVQRTRNGVRLKVDAYDREMNQMLVSGYLSTIDNQIDQTTGTVKLRATFSNSTAKLFPNQFVNARLLVEEKTGITLLPSAAIQRNAQSTYVFLVKPDQTATVRQISIGTTDGENTEVKSGLQPGDVVVMTGVDKLQEGSKVTVHMDGETNTGGGRAGHSRAPSGTAGKGASE